MAKRTATNVLNHDNWNVEDDPEDAGSFKRASADVLKTRVYKTARRRNPIGSIAPSTSTTTADESTEKRNVFGGFTGFSKAPVSTTAAFGSIFNNNKTADNQPKVNGISHLNTTTMDDPNKTNNEDKQHDEAYFSRLKGLNSSVASWIKRHVDENPFVNLKPVFQDYERYFDELELKKKSGQLDKTDSKASTTLANDLSIASTSNSSNTQQFSFGIKPTVSSNERNEKTQKDAKSQLSMFGAGAPSSNLTNMFSFGASKPTSSNTTSSSVLSTSTSPKFSFGGSGPQTTSATSTTSMFKPPPSSGATGFSFGGGGVTSTPTAPFTFTSVSSSTSKTATSEETGTTAAGEADEDEPPKVEFTPVDEDGHVYKVRCKVFVKKDKEKTFGDRGVGNMFLKPIPDSEKMQLIVRADTNLGNLLCNFVLSSAIPTKRLGKKDVMLVCIPTPDVAPPPVPILLRVKSPEEADELLATLEKHKK